MQLKLPSGTTQNFNDVSGSTFARALDGLPRMAPIGVPYGVTAVIREANGDLGARASCVLLVDGVEVDRAAGISIDAGGAVTCQMSHLFAAAGTANVSVALAGASRPTSIRRTTPPPPSPCASIPT